jgi:hypothetical protein
MSRVDHVVRQPQRVGQLKHAHRNAVIAPPLREIHGRAIRDRAVALVQQERDLFGVRRASVG